MSGSVVSELVLKFTGDTANAMAAIGALDSKVASAVKNYVSNLGVLDSSLSRSATNQVEAFSKGQIAAAKAAIAQGTVAQAANDLTKAQAAVVKSTSASAEVQALAASKVEAAQGKLVLAQDAASKATKSSADAASASTTKFGSMTSAIGLVGAGVLVAGVLLAKGAANFQQSTTILATSGGETAKELEAARQGILRLSGSTGTATSELTKGLYMLGSAGFDVAHGGLQALQAGAQGAKAENADLGTVTNALSTVLTDYGIKISNNAAGQKTANAVMDEMIAITSNGKTTTEALAGSLHSVLPVAAAAGLSFAQVGGAMATMTGEGVSADQAAQNLANAIRSLQNPSSVASKEMQAMGLNSNDVASQLGKKGLTGTISDLTTAITAHMGPAGMVIQDTFRSSKIAAQDANLMIAKMPPNLQTLAKAYMDGSVTAKEWRKDLLALDPVSRNLMTQFGATANKTHQFNDLLASGSPDAQTYTAALSKMMGGATGLAVALKLSGDHAGTFNSDVGKVSDAAKTAGSSVDGWKLIQGNFNQKLSEAKLSLQAVGITIGTALLPVFSSFMSIVLKIVGPITSFINSNQGLIKTLGPLALGLAAAGVAVWVLNAALGANPIVLITLAIIAGVTIITTAIYLLVKNWTTIWNAIVSAAETVGSAILSFFKQWWPLLLGVFLGPLGLILGAIIKWHEQIWQEIQKVWGSVEQFFVSVWGAITAAASAAWNFISNTILIPIWNNLKADAIGVFTAIENAIQAVWNAVSTAASVTWNFISNTVILPIWNALKTAAVTIFTALQNAIQAVWNTISTAASVMWNAISLVVQTIWNALKLAATTVFTAIQNAIQFVWDTVKTAAQTMWGSISLVVTTVWDTLKSTATTVFTGIQNVIQGVWDNIKSAASTMWNAIVQAVKLAWNAITAVVGTPINAVIDVVNAFTGGASKVLDIVGVTVLDKAHIDPVKFATGGQVPGGWGGGDTVPAMLTPGERVLSTSQVKHMGGHNNIDNMLGMAHGGAVPVQYFADGGIVVSGGMVNGTFRGSYKDAVDGKTYQDMTPPGGGGPQTPGIFLQPSQLTAIVNGSDSVKNQGGSIIPGPVKAVAGAVASGAGLITGALVGLGEVFIKGALIAAANLALAPLKAAVGALPDNPMGAALGKGTANKVLDGIYNFITQQDNAKGQDPVSTSISGVPVTPALEKAALDYATATFAGLPYTWGNNDCSGIVQKSYSHVGIGLPRVSSTQYQASTPVTEAQAVPGDLAFYNPGESGAPAGLPGHVGFYAGNGKIFDAYNTSRPIGFDPLSLPGNTFMGIRRPGSGTGGGAQGPAPAGTGPGSAMTAQQWAVDFLGMLGAPTNPGMVNFIWEWEAAEGGTWLNAEQHNPLNIAAFDSNPNNSQSNFPTWAAGLAAAVRVLGQSNMSGLRAGIMSGNPAAALAALVASPWASSHYNGGASFPKSPGSYGSTPHLAEGGIVGYDVGAWDTGYRAHMAMIHPNEMIIPAGPASAIRSGANVFGGDSEYVSNRGHGAGQGIDYDKLAAAMKAHSSVHVDNINVTQSDASPSDIMDEFNWNMRVARLAV